MVIREIEPHVLEERAIHQWRTEFCEWLDLHPDIASRMKYAASLLREGCRHDLALFCGENELNNSFYVLNLLSSSPEKLHQVVNHYFTSLPNHSDDAS